MKAVAIIKDDINLQMSHEEFSKLAENTAVLDHFSAVSKCTNGAWSLVISSDNLQKSIESNMLSDDFEEARKQAVSAIEEKAKNTKPLSLIRKYLAHDFQLSQCTRKVNGTSDTLLTVKFDIM